MEFECVFRSRFPSICGKGWVGGEVTGALPGEPHGLRAGEDVPLQSGEEGSKMDLLERSEPWQEVLRVRRCEGEPLIIVLSAQPLHFFSYLCN